MRSFTSSSDNKGKCTNQSVICRSSGCGSGGPHDAQVLSVRRHCEHGVSHGVQRSAAQDSHQSAVSPGAAQAQRLHDGGAGTREHEGQGRGAHLLADWGLRQRHPEARGIRTALPMLSLFLRITSVAQKYCKTLSTPQVAVLVFFVIPFSF